MKVAIIDYGAGNIASVQNALARLGVSAISTADQELIRNADKVIFPGVGEAGSAMKKLREKKLDQLIPHQSPLRITARRSVGDDRCRPLTLLHPRKPLVSCFVPVSSFHPRN